MSDLNIFQKISKVMEDVNYLQKDGTVSFKTTNYKYLSEEKITSAVRESMIKHGLVIYPKFIQQLESGNEFIDEFIITYKLVNTDNPDDSIEIQAKGSGQDRGDKKAYKAATGAFKYVQIQTFMIPRGDDPDIQSTDENLEKIEKATKGEKPTFIKSVNGIKDKIPEKEFNKLCDDFEIGNWKLVKEETLKKTEQIEFFKELKKMIKFFKEQEKNGSKKNGELPF